MFHKFIEMNKVALITGITGQDGAYLAEFLINKGYSVHGIKRRASSLNTDRIDHLYVDLHEDDVRLTLHYGDLTDATNLIRIIQEVQPDEIYNLAAQSHVKVSFDSPEYTANTDALGTLRILEAIRILNMVEKVKFYQASTSELYGLAQEVPQNEQTPFYPRSPYGVAKLYGYWIVKNYREAYGIYGCNGILFNHESPVRGETFVTRKITRAVARISLGMQQKIYIGNLDAKRDWGHAKDYIEGMWLMLQQDSADDYVLATGKTYTVRHFCELAFKEIGVDIIWEGTGDQQQGKNSSTNQVVIEVDKKYYRPTEVDLLIGDASKAEKVLGWKPKYSLNAMVSEMVKSDIKLFQKQQVLKNNGFEVNNYFD